MSKLYNLAKMNTTTTGTGTITLGSAISGFLTFAQAGVQDGDIVSYGIVNGNNREVGTGTYTASGITLTRSVTNSTNSNSLLNLTGTSTVFITTLSSDVSELASRPYVHIRDEKAQNTAGGTFTSGAWQTRTLNTEVSDTENIASLSSNQITLPAGTYYCDISCPAFRVDRHQARLYNITDATTLLTGTGEYTINGTDTSGNKSIINGKFTLSAPKVLEIQHRASITYATQGFGVEANLTTEVYTEAEFWKIDSNIAINTSVINQPYIYIRDEKSQNTNGGTFTSGAWQTRTLNTVSSNTENIGSLSSNQITLPAGTYYLKARCPGFSVGRAQARLQNISDATTTLIGNAGYPNADPVDGLVPQIDSFITGKFTISSSKIFEVQHRCEATNSTYGFGVAANFTTEIYTEIELWKLDTGSATYKEYEIDYVERTTNLTVTATSSATAQQWIDCNSITLDGSTRIKIEVYANYGSASSGQDLLLNLYDDTTDLGQIYVMVAGSSSLVQTLYCARYLVPTAGTHTFKIKAWKTGGTVSIPGEAGGTGSYLPGFVRITRA